VSNTRVAWRRSSKSASEPTLADLLGRLGPIPAHRIQPHPALGTAIEGDVVEILDRENIRVFRGEEFLTWDDVSSGTEISVADLLALPRPRVSPLNGPEA
jgi:hypothetical protein